MTLRPLKAEVTAVAELLVSEDYENPEDMAWNVVKLVGQMREMRPVYVGVSTVAGVSVMTGPYPTMDSVQVGADRGEIPSTTGGCMIAKMVGPAYWKEHL